MQSVQKLVSALFMALVTIAGMAVLLIGLPRLDYVGNAGGAWSGEVPIRLLPILLHFEAGDSILCFEGAPDFGCLRAKLLTGALFDQLSEDSGALLVRNFGWFLWCSLLFCAFRVAYYFKPSRQVLIETAAEIESWLPIAHLSWLIFAMAVAYLLSLQ